MKNKLRQEKGITMMALVVTIIILLILTSVLVFNTQDSVYIKRLNNLYSDIELLRAKTDEYYNEYGQIPAKIKYENKIQLEKLKNVRSTKNDTGNFYVIDLEAMEGITLNYGKDYENVKNVYTINEFVGVSEELPNPYGKPLTAYGECFEILTGLIDKLADKLNSYAKGEE